MKNVKAMTEIDFKVSYCVVLHYSVHQFKAFHYGPGQAFRAAGGEAPRIHRQRHMKVVKTYTRRLYLAGDILVLLSVTG